MKDIEHLARLHAAGGLSRRDFIGRALALGATAPFLSASIFAAEAATPKKGGILRLGLAGGSTTDSMDPTTWTDSVPLDIGFGIFNQLVENDAANKAAPDLAESWEGKAGATEWVFNLRKGVQFSNGKDFSADDAIYSLNLHRGEKTKSGAAASMKAIKEIKKLDSHQILIVLDSGDADLPNILTDYHVMMVPDGYTDWSKPIGTGAMVLEEYEPGVRCSLKKNEKFWRTDRGYLDGAEITVIADSSARMSALISGQVDAINRVDTKTVSLIEKKKTLAINRSPAGWHPVIAMAVDRAPYNNVDVCLAMKYAIDRKQILKTMFSDFGALGNDHPIPRSDPYFNSELPQREYDADKAAFHLKKSGVDPKIVIQASEAAFNGAVDMSTIYQASAKKAGLKVDLKREPADGFWNDVWLKGACVTSYWGGRPTATQMLSVAYQSTAAWNETHYKSEKFDGLLSDAKKELDPAKRKTTLWALQEMLSNEGGAVIPAFRDYVDAHVKTVGGMTPHGGFDMLNGRVLEKAYFTE